MAINVTSVKNLEAFAEGLRERTASLNTRCEVLMLEFERLRRSWQGDVHYPAFERAFVKVLDEMELFIEACVEQQEELDGRIRYLWDIINNGPGY